MLKHPQFDAGRWRNPAIWLGFIAAFLLFYVRDLGEESLWIDEYSALDFATRGLAGAIQAAATDVHPPAYFVVLHFWVKAFGQSDLSLRLPSAIFSALALILLYLLGKRVCGRKVAVMAVCFSIASPFYLLFSHMARYYTMALAASLLSTLLLALALERKGRTYWLAYGLGCALVLYTDYPASTIIGAHGIYLLGRELVHRLLGQGTAVGREAVRGWLMGALAGLVLYVPWLSVAIGRAMQGSQDRAADYAGGLMGIALKLMAFVYSFSVGETILPWNPLAVMALVAVLLALFVGLAVRHGGTEASIMLTTFLGVSLVSTILVTTLVMPVVSFLNVASRTMFAFPFFALLVAAGLAKMRKWAWVAVALIGASNVVGYANYVSGSGFLNPVYAVPSKQIAADVEAEVKPGDVVISTVDTVFERYYGANSAARSPHFLASSWDRAKVYIEGNRTERVWLITLGLDTNREAYPSEVVNWLRSNYVLTMSKGYAEQDQTYRSIKERLLGREAYRYKAVLEMFEKKS